MKLYLSVLMRRVLLPIFARFNPGDITIRHHYTGRPVVLHSFRHKGYWFYGKDRERSSMQMFQSLINPGATVLEVGGHIGYISLYFDSLVGRGRVIVFEPGGNNLPYLRRNLEGSSAEIVPMAVGAAAGTAKFFLDPLTGQNNSLVKCFRGFEQNKKSAGLERLAVEEVEVLVVTLDEFTSERGLRVSFIKIDVEGFEWEVLKGSSKLLREQHPRLMVEVQSNHEEVFEFLTKCGYVLFSPECIRLGSARELKENVFCLHAQSDAELVARLFLK